MCIRDSFAFELERVFVEALHYHATLLHRGHPPGNGRTGIFFANTQRAGRSTVDVTGANPVASVATDRHVQKVFSVAEENRITMPHLTATFVERCDLNRIATCLLYTSDAADERSSVDL